MKSSTDAAMNTIPHSNRRSGLTAPIIDVPESILAERNNYLTACRRTPTGRRNIDKIKEVIDVIVKWSLDHPTILEFASAMEKDQKTLGFRKRADGNLLWETYPDRKGTEAKLCFFTRAGTYMSSEIQANLLKRFTVDLEVTREINPGGVMELPMRRFAKQDRLTGLTEFLSWAIKEPGHFGSRQAAVEHTGSANHRY